MSEIGGVNAQRHFSGEEEEALRRDESTSSIVKRDAKTSVDIHGLDRSLVQTKHHQQSPMDNKFGAIEIGKAAVEGAELAGYIHAGAAGAIALPVVGLWLGGRSLVEAHVEADEQTRAATKDQAHAALIGVLDLPEAYKASRLEGEYRGVDKESRNTAFKMIEGIKRDPKGLAVLQLHADRGMNAARDLSRSGISAEAFLKTNPRAAESYSKDAAFREGFDAYLYTRATLPQSEVKALDTKLDERDGWYARSQISFRM